MLLLCACLAAQADPVDALHAAARAGDIDAIRKLVSEAADINAVKQSEGGSPLYTATNWNNFEAVKTLISLGANVNAGGDRGATLLRAAGRDTRIVKLLIDAGADVNYAEPKFRYTPLSSAAGNQSETFVTLTESGGYTGPFPDSLETVRLLIEAGANPSHVDAFSASPLRTAMRVGNTEIARLLLRAGADVHQKIPAGIGSQKGDTVLMETIGHYAVHRDIAAIRLLLDFGANPNDRNEMDYQEDQERRGGPWQGYSVLSYAARHGFHDIVTLLLERGADPTLSRTDGVTAYDLALREKHPKTAALLNAYLQKAGKL